MYDSRSIGRSSGGDADGGAGGMSTALQSSGGAGGMCAERPCRDDVDDADEICESRSDIGEVQPSGGDVVSACGMCVTTLLTSYGEGDSRLSGVGVVGADCKCKARSGRVDVRSSGGKVDGAGDLCAAQSGGDGIDDAGNGY